MQKVNVKEVLRITRLSLNGQIRHVRNTQRARAAMHALMFHDFPECLDWWVDYGDVSFCFMKTPKVILVLTFYGNLALVVGEEFKTCYLSGGRCDYQWLKTKLLHHMGY